MRAHRASKRRFLGCDSKLYILYHTLIGSAKSGNGGAPNAGRIDTTVSITAVNGTSIARHTAIMSFFANLQNKYKWLSNLHNLFQQQAIKSTLIEIEFDVTSNRTF